MSIGQSYGEGQPVLAVPALRARREDIPLLVEPSRLRCNRDDQLAVQGFTREALALFEADAWPGNVRELESVVHQAMAVRRLVSCVRRT